MLTSPRTANRSGPVNAAKRGQGVTAVLGPTNTGKTHYAIERMVAHSSGLIGLPLRLLAREVYSRVVEKVGPELVALVTGEERIKPPGARYWVSTVEAMPRDLDVSFVAIDEVQLCADLERGHVFTDRMLNLRGRDETLLLGSDSMLGILNKLLPGLTVAQRPRLSQLVYTGQRKITRLPRRTAIVAFSADDVYAIAELVRRQRGGAAVVMGALSPQTRNAQVQLYQDGEVDYLVATDAIGMGLNLDVDHVAFAGARKFDGFQFRHLNLMEMGQIAGRAGRHLRDGTFGVTSRVQPLEADAVERLEGHIFPSIEVLQWRNGRIDTSSMDALRKSLNLFPDEPGLTRAPEAEDVRVLETAMRDPDIRDMASTPDAVKLLWEASQLPDYRKIAPAQHSDLVTTLYGFLMREGHIPETWIHAQVKTCDRTDGDIDTLSQRIAHIRTWTFVAHREGWLENPLDWQQSTRALEDRLSDALHERLTQRFVDRRTSRLARRLREKAILDASVADNGDVTVEDHLIGQLEGFRFTPDASADATQASTLRAAAAKSLAGEIQRRGELVCAAIDDAFSLDGGLRVVWRGAPIGNLTAGADWLAPQVSVLADEHLTGPVRDGVEERLKLFVKRHIDAQLKPLLDLKHDETLTGAARGIAFQIVESLGILDREPVAEQVRSLAQEDRGLLRKHGVRFGAFHIFVPALLKPHPRKLIAQLWALEGGGATGTSPAEVDETHVPTLVASGRTSVERNEAIPDQLYAVLGFKVFGGRAVRIDILERVGDVIRTYLSWRPLTPGEKPAGAVDGSCFVLTPELTSLLGSSHENVGIVLAALGFRRDRKTQSEFSTMLEKVARKQSEEAATGKASDADGAGSDTAAADADTPDAADTEIDANAEAAVPEAPASDAPEAVQALAETPAAEEAVEAVVETPAEIADEAAPDVALELRSTRRPLRQMGLKQASRKHMLLKRRQNPARSLNSSRSGAHAVGSPMRVLARGVLRAVTARARREPSGQRMALLMVPGITVGLISLKVLHVAKARDAARASPVNREPAVEISAVEISVVAIRTATRTRTTTAIVNLIPIRLLQSSLP